MILIEKKKKHNSLLPQFIMQHPFKLSNIKIEYTFDFVYIIKNKMPLFIP